MPNLHLCRAFLLRGGNILFFAPRASSVGSGRQQLLRGKILMTFTFFFVYVNVVCCGCCDNFMKQIGLAKLIRIIIIIIIRYTRNMPFAMSLSLLWIYDILVCECVWQQHTRDCIFSNFSSLLSTMACGWLACTQRTCDGTNNNAGLHPSRRKIKNWKMNDAFQ